MVKFTRIKNWAERKGFKIEEGTSGTRPYIKVIVNNKNEGFKLEDRKSTIYRSIRGMKGKCAGIYLEVIQKGKTHYDFHKTSQRNAIESMERDLERYFKDEKEDDTMENKTYKGYLANEIVSGTKIATAREGEFFNGYTVMHMVDLNENVEGSTPLLHENLQTLVKYKNELKEGKRVNVHLEWELTEDGYDYTNVKVLRVDVEEQVEEIETNKQKVERVAKEDGKILGCWDEKINSLTDEELEKILQGVKDEVDTDVKLNGVDYVAEISYVDGEIDVTMITKSEYIGRYGNERYEDE
jgi:hypothetical protein